MKRSTVHHNRLKSLVIDRSGCKQACFHWFVIISFVRCFYICLTSVELCARQVMNICTLSCLFFPAPFFAKKLYNWTLLIMHHLESFLHINMKNCCIFKCHGSFLEIYPQHTAYRMAE